MEQGPNFSDLFVANGELTFLSEATPPVGFGVLADHEIERYVPIEPFQREPVEKGVVSYGLTSYGYDCRVGYKFKVFTPALCGVVDPKSLDPKVFVDVDLTPGRSDTPEQGFILIPPNSFALAETVERFDIPKDVLGFCVGKSTYARCGIVVPVTPLEPGWRGRVTVEICNTSPIPAKVYAGEGIMQIVFFRGNPCRFSYDKKGRDGGKYMDQEGLTLPFTKPE